MKEIFLQQTGDNKTAVIIGAGPAGLTAAYELLHKTSIKPVIYEMTSDIGGISKTVNYKGNRIDIGGHRFFSKSDKIMEWWKNILPVQGILDNDEQVINRQNKFTDNIILNRYGSDPEKIDDVMLIRKRLSLIFFLRRFFDYPVSLSFNTIVNLGPVRITKIGLTYLISKIFPIKKEKSLEDFFINRFGLELYLTFFKDYTEKVWGIECSQISPEWGAQRIKGLSVIQTIIHAIKKKIKKDNTIGQKNTETTLIEQFMYPKLGPGQLWEKVAEIIKEKNGEIYLNHKVAGCKYENNHIVEIKVKNEKTGIIKYVKGDYFFSSMPVKDLIDAFEHDIPEEVSCAARGLIYRDFITVGLLLKKLKIKNESKIKTHNNSIPDNWIYVQEKEVKLGRIQIFNNWSPYMVRDPDTVWIGLEYFCNEGDELWNKSDKDFIEFSVNELVKINMINTEDILDITIIRIPITYPAYFGSYDMFDIIKDFTDKFENLFLIGRNGMHKYNNQDHSMLTAMIAVENIINNIKSKDNIWQVNIEREYHEEK